MFYISFKDLYFHVKGTVTERWDTERYHSWAGSLPKWLHRMGLRQAEARHQVSHVGTRTQATGTSPAFPGMLAGNWTETGTQLQAVVLLHHNIGPFRIHFWRIPSNILSMCPRTRMCRSAGLIQALPSQHSLAEEVQTWQREKKTLTKSSITESFLTV